MEVYGEGTLRSGQIDAGGGGVEVNAATIPDERNHLHNYIALTGCIFQPESKNPRWKTISEIKPAPSKSALLITRLNAFQVNVDNVLSSPLFSFW